MSPACARLKAWVAQRRAVFNGETAVAGLDPPKGVLLLGVQGCGKSLAAKAIAGGFGVPLVRLDFGSMYDKYHGETERHLRESLRNAEALAPCVLWIDEIEKGLATSGSDDGVSKRVLGYLLTWMAERKAQVFLVATANAVKELPAELLRKGRFDEIFFVDLPDPAVRAEIFRLHLPAPQDRLGRLRARRAGRGQRGLLRRRDRAGHRRRAVRRARRRRPGRPAPPRSRTARHPPAVGADGRAGQRAARVGGDADGAGGLRRRPRAAAAL